MSRAVLAWGRVAGPAAIVAVLIWRVGTGPFLDGVRTIDARALGAAAGLAALTTTCCAWRWRIVAARLGVGLSLPTAVAAYYRSQFLNLTLPGGVVGDVHRGLSHGREVGAVGRALRAVAWERAAGQGVQLALTVVVLATLPSPVRHAMPLLALGLAVVAALGAVLAFRTGRGRGRSAWSRIRDAAIGDIRQGLLARRAWPGIAVTSTLVVAGHVITFVVAARTAGVTAPVSRLLPLALLAMLAMTLPSVAGWGPREGATAWVFGVAGLGAGHGVATAVVYGVMVLFASLPGAVFLVLAWFRARPRRRARTPLAERAAHA